LLRQHIPLGFVSFFLLDTASLFFLSSFSGDENIKRQNPSARFSPHNLISSAFVVLCEAKAQLGSDKTAHCSAEEAEDEGEKVAERRRQEGKLNSSTSFTFRASKFPFLVLRLLRSLSLSLSNRINLFVNYNFLRKSALPHRGIVRTNKF
jgi:hypothetical protein